MLNRGEFKRENLMCCMMQSDRAYAMSGAVAHQARIAVMLRRQS